MEIISMESPLRKEGKSAIPDWKATAAHFNAEVEKLRATRDKSTGTIVRHRVAFQHLAHHWTFRFLPRSVRNHMREECI